MSFDTALQPIGIHTSETHVHVVDQFMKSLWDTLPPSTLSSLGMASGLNVLVSQLQQPCLGV